MGMGIVEHFETSGSRKMWGYINSDPCVEFQVV